MRVRGNRLAEKITAYVHVAAGALASVLVAVASPAHASHHFECGTYKARGVLSFDASDDPRLSPTLALWEGTMSELRFSVALDSGVATRLAALGRKRIAAEFEFRVPTRGTTPDHARVTDYSFAPGSELKAGSSPLKLVRREKCGGP